MGSRDLPILKSPRPWRWSTLRRKQTDFAVLEVGLGGRLDSTNVCQPLVSVITSISFDHTEILGNSLEEIASEKAGIIKDKVPVVCGVVEEAPRQVISDVAMQHGCRLRQLGSDFSYEYYPPCKTDQFDADLQGTMDYDCGAVQLKGVNLALLGRHQAANAAVALTVLNELQNHGMAGAGNGDTAWAGRGALAGAGGNCWPSAHGCC